MGPDSTFSSLASARWSGGDPDEILVAATLEGDEEAFGALVRRHREMAIKIAAQIVGRIGAEDVVQDSLLLAFRALRSIQVPSRFSRWFAAITRFRALRVSRSETRRRFGTVSLDEKLLQTVSSIALEPRREEDGDEQLIKALERIPPRYAEVMRLHFFHGLPHGEIAEFVDAPLSTVKWRCFRGKELLRIALRSVGGGAARVEEACRRCGSEAARDGCPGPCPGERKLVRHRLQSGVARPAEGRGPRRESGH